jgi:hypothetical protein
VEEPNESLLAFADDNELTIHHLGIAEGLFIVPTTLLSKPLNGDSNYLLLQVGTHGIL